MEVKIVEVVAYKDSRGVVHSKKEYAESANTRYLTEMLLVELLGADKFYTDYGFASRLERLITNPETRKKLTDIINKVNGSL